MVKNEKEEGDTDFMAYFVLSYAGPKRNIKLRCFLNSAGVFYDNLEEFSNSTLQVCIESGGDFESLGNNFDDPSLHHSR